MHVEQSNKSPIIAIVGNVTTSAQSKEAAIDLGKALAKKGYRIMVYSSDPEFLENAVVKGYVESQEAKSNSIEVLYPYNKETPQFEEQKNHAHLFDWRPDSRGDWEMSFYSSLKEVDGAVFLGGGDSTMIAGLVALGHQIAIISLPGFKGKAQKIWEIIQPGIDLPNAEEKSLMARPDWSPKLASQCVDSIHNQLKRRDERKRKIRLEELRKETSITWHAILSVIFFTCAMLCIPLAFNLNLNSNWIIPLLFFSPLLAGTSGSTIRLVFDLREGILPLSRQSVITTAALGLIAGGVVGTLFIAAQFNILDQALIIQKSAKLVPFVVAVGFIAGFTLDAVFRKIMSADVTNLNALEIKKDTDK